MPDEEKERGCGANLTDELRRWVDMRDQGGDDREDR